MGKVFLCPEEIGGADFPWLKQKKFLKVMDLPARQTLSAVRQVIEAGDALREEECGVVASMEGLDSGLVDWEKALALGKSSTGKEELNAAEVGNYLTPLALIPRLPNSIAGHLAREFSATGPCWTSGEKNLSGLEAVVQGARWIADGECERVIVVRVERAGAMAMILSSSPGKGKNRKILSWSVETPERSDVNDFKLTGLGDWNRWENAMQLWAVDEISGLRIILEPA